MIQLTINGQQHAVEVDGEASLLTVLRDQLDLTGSKIGCAEGQCGVCTVLVADVPTRACITPANTVVGRPILTIEGLAHDGRLHPLQQAFLDVEAFQCGYCTPGMIMAACGLLRHNRNPTTNEITLWMQGNLCRCGTYPRIVRAIQQAAAELRANETGGTA